MCHGHVTSLKHHTLVDLNGKRVITSGHEFVIQHNYPYEISGLPDQINQLCLVVSHDENNFCEGSLAVEPREYTRVESVGSLISVTSG